MNGDFRLVTTKTPIRITFTGGGSDFPDFYRNNGYGAVLSSTINRYIYVTIARNFYSNEYRISYSKTENAIKNVDNIEHPTVREALKFLGIEGGIQIISITEIPSRGTGLGSSSSFLVGLLLALHTWLGENVTPETLAREAYKIEREILREPGGKQDQYISAYGGINLMRFNHDDSVEMKPLILSREKRKYLSENLMMYYTNKERSSAAIHKEQLNNIEDQSDYYRKMRELAYKAYDALCKMDINELGALMEENWLLKKQLHNQISDDGIDHMYKIARDAGALGGKLMGAGGGGFMLFIVPPERQKEVSSALSEYRREYFEIDPFGSRVTHIEDY